MNRRDQLLDAAIGYAAKRGLADLSLRPLAAAVGTSARLLIFHFGSKDRLLLELLAEVQGRFQRRLERFVREDGDGRVPRMRRYWDLLVEPENLRLLRVLFEAHVLAMRDQEPFRTHVSTTSRDWVTLVQSQLPAPLRSPELAMLCAAVFDGLLLEVLASGRKAAPGRALDRFIELLRAAPGMPA